MIVAVSAAPAQVTVKLVVPLTVSESLTDAGLRQRVERIIEREVRFRFEYELFIKDLTALGRQAVPHILGSVDHAVADRFVTEALLRRTAKLPWFGKGGDSLSAKKLESIRAQIRHPDAIVEDILTKTLREMKPAAGAELLLVLADESNGGIRLAACNAGLTLLDPELASAFVRFLRDPGTRPTAARANGVLHRPAAQLGPSQAPVALSRDPAATLPPRGRGRVPVPGGQRTNT
jgi:hypothetical protein